MSLIFWRHFAPLFVLVILMAVTTVIAVRARIKTEKQYKKVLDNLYALYSLNSDDISDEQWEAFLEEYDPTDYKKYTRKVSRFPKKIRRNNAGIPPEPRTLLKLSCNKTKYGI